MRELQGLRSLKLKGFTMHIINININKESTSTSYWENRKGGRSCDDTLVCRCAGKSHIFHFITIHTDTHTNAHTSTHACTHINTLPHTPTHTPPHTNIQKSANLNHSFRLTRPRTQHWRRGSLDVPFTPEWSMFTISSISNPTAIKIE